MNKKNKKILGIIIILAVIIGGIFLVVNSFSDDGKKTSAPAEIAPKAVSINDNKGVMVLNYHKVENKNMSLAINIDDFDKQMKWLKDCGCNTITPDQLYDFITNGAELPENPVLITFDDGYADNYKNAYPILKKYGFKATIFVVTSFLGKYDNYLTWAQAKELVDNGFNIESHTANHKIMTEVSDEELREELELSRKEISNQVGKESFYIAYPTGTYNLHIAQLIKDAGYKAAFTIKFDNVSRNSNVYALERVPIFHTEKTNKDFLERIKYLPIYEKTGWNKN